MSAGAILEIYGENGGLQVSGEQIGFGLSGYGAVTLTDDGQQHFLPTVTATITVQGTNPVLAFRPQAERYVTVSYVAPVSGGYAFTLICQSSSPVGLQWWAFDAAARTMLDPTMDDVVAALWDANGVKTFDMAMASAMRVMATTTFTLAPVVSPPPVGGTLTDQSQVTAVPSGRVWAIAQATLAMGGEQFDTGQYSLQDVSPETGPVVGDQTPPAGAKWRYQHTRGYRSMAGYVAPDQIWTGFRIHEETIGEWVPVEQGAGYAIAAGNIDYLLLDVTNLPTAPMPDPGALTVSISGPTQEVVVQATGPADSISPACTATATGGVGPYTYEWQYVSGSTLIAAYDPISAQAFRTQSLNQPAGETRAAIWRCKATDSQGHVGYSQGVTFRHIVQLINYIPNPISVSNLSLLTNDNAGRTNTSMFQIVGTTAAITLRFTRSNNGGDAYLKRQYIYVGPSASGPWTEYFMGINTAPLDISVAPNAYVYVQGAFETLSGRATGSWDMTIANQFTGGGLLASFSVSGVVDDNNDYNVPDYTLTPGAIALTNNNGTSTTGDATASFGGGYATGINRQITLTAIISPVFRGGSAASFFTVYVGTGSVSWDNGDTSDKSFSFSANPGDFVGASAALSMFPGSGDAYAYWHVDLFNSSTGEFVSGYDGGLTTSR